MPYNNQFGSICNPNKPIKMVSKPYEKPVKAGKNTYVYDAHTYHTKVPPEGIELLIDYYTNEDDVVLDPFCGSGMTGIAAQRIGRKALLSDLSPAATFIADNFNAPINANAYWEAVNELIQRAESLRKKLYTTHCRECGKETEILYTIWSYKLICKYCEKDFLLWDVGRDERPTVKESKIKAEFNCPYCGKLLKKRQLKRTELIPVALGYKCCSRSLKEKVCPLSDEDVANLQSITYNSIPKTIWYPTEKFPQGVNTNQPITNGIDSVEKAYFPRALWAFAYLWNESANWPDPVIREKLLFTLTSLYQRITKFSAFRFWGGSGNTANYNVPQIINEQNVFLAFLRKAKTIWLYFNTEKPFKNGCYQISTQSACHLSQLKDNSVDYVFTDPPFGANINYSEMNFLWESWLQEHTDNTEEAIVNKTQNKTSTEYGDLMYMAISEIHRVLKYNGWMTIMFHNSSDKIWQELQKAISSAGFVIDGTVLFDKVHGTFKQYVSDNTVGFDLLLNCRKQHRKNVAYSPYKMTNDLAVNKEDRNQVALFVSEQLKKGMVDYVSHFEHVKRKDEFNYRKLYSEWIASIVGDEAISIDFEEFRQITDTIINKEEGND